MVAGYQLQLTRRLISSDMGLNMSIFPFFPQSGTASCYRRECPPVSCDFPALTPGDCCETCNSKSYFVFTSFLVAYIGTFGCCNFSVLSHSDVQPIVFLLTMGTMRCSCHIVYKSSDLTLSLFVKNVLPVSYSFDASSTTHQLNRLLH